MFVSALVALFACSGETPKPAPKPVSPPPPPAPAFEPKHKAMFGVLPEDFAGDKKPSKDLVDLGRALYYDPRLSKGDEVSCNSCHLLDAWGVDNKPFSPGVGGTLGGRNSPTTYNAGGHLAQFWDGRAPNLEEQAKGPVLNPVEMAMPDDAAVAKKLAAIPAYVDLFKAAFPGEADPVSFGNMAKAIAAFETGLVTKNSKFDQYMGGKEDALSADEVAGLDLFVSTGCASCHSGALVGGGMYQKLGVVEKWETKDVGRFEVTKNEADRFLFKVPSLRNVAKTGPYLHDGSVASLDEMVTKMAKHQLGKDLAPADAAKIVGFLGTLTGELPTDYVKMPNLPGDGKGGKAKAGEGDGEGKAGKGKAGKNG